MNTRQALPGYVFNHGIGETTPSPSSTLESQGVETRRVYTPIRTEHLIPGRMLKNSPTPSKGVRLLEINSPQVPRQRPVQGYHIADDELSVMATLQPAKIKDDRALRIQKYMSRRSERKNMLIFPKKKSLEALNSAIMYHQIRDER